MRFLSMEGLGHGFLRLGGIRVCVFDPPTLVMASHLFPQTPSGGLLKENPAPGALTGKKK